ncbi:MAG: glycosyltransferase family 2 protein [Fibrobacterota bacterium]
MRLSACLITRDEDGTLPRCLSSLSGVVDEICLLDTGSKDRTVEIARSFGAVVGFRPWDQDFSAARNAGLELSTGDWVLQIDADEEIDRDSVTRLREDLESGPPCRLVDVLLLDGTTKPGTVKLPRLFRRDDKIRYRRPVHESVLDSLADAGLPSPIACELKLVHHGYQPQMVESRGKFERNLSILRAARDRGNVDAYDLYKLATTLPTWDRTGERTGALETAWNTGMAASPGTRAQWPWWDRLVQSLCMDLARRGFLSRAVEIANTSIASDPIAHPFARTALAEIHLRAGFAGPCREHCAAALVEIRQQTGFVALGGKEEAELEWIAARAAQASRDRTAFLAHLERCVELGSLEGRCLQAAWKISEKFAEGWKELDLLLRSDARHPSVLLVASEAARSQGDRSTSDLLLEQSARIPSDSGRMADCRLWMRAWLDGKTPAFDLPPFDVESAAIHCFLAMSTHVPWRPDPFLHQGSLRSALADILESLLEAGREDAVRRFAQGAATRDADLPGISRLVEDA